MKKTIPFIIIGLIFLGAVFYLNSQKSGEEMMDKTAREPGVGTRTKAQMDETEKDMANKNMMNSYTDLSPMEAKKLIDENPEIIIVDVSPRYDEGHLPGAINAYVGDGTLDEIIPEWDSEAKYLVYCHVDSASILGAQKLVNAGFENVYRLSGNYSAWVNAGYDIEK